MGKITRKKGPIVALNEAEIVESMHQVDLVSHSLTAPVPLNCELEDMQRWTITSMSAVNNERQKVVDGILQLMDRSADYCAWICETSIDDLAAEFGIPASSFGRYTKKPRELYRQQQEEKVISLSAEMSQRKIAAAVGMTASKVQRILKKNTPVASLEPVGGNEASTPPSPSGRKMAIVLNGPPGSGKDFAADFIAKNFSFTHKEFKEPLYKMAGALADFCGMGSKGFLMAVESRYFKDQADCTLANRTPREAMIAVSENMIKPVFGADVFGQLAAAEVLKAAGDVVFSDGGFNEEVAALGSAGIDVFIIKLRRDGCDFSNDSRDYIDIPGIEPYWIDNNFSKEIFQGNLSNAIYEFTGRQLVQ